MLSMMDVVLEIPMSQVLDHVPIDQESKAVLLGGASRLRPFYQLMLAQESGEGKTASELAAQLQLAESEVAERYWQAMQWGTSGEFGLSKEQLHWMMLGICVRRTGSSQKATLQLLLCKTTAS
jgi:hypothetical protein